MQFDSDTLRKLDALQSKLIREEGIKKLNEIARQGAEKKKVTQRKRERKQILFSLVRGATHFYRGDLEQRIYEIFVEISDGMTVDELWHRLGAELPMGEIKDALRRIRSLGHVEYADPIGWRFTESMMVILKKAKRMLEDEEDGKAVDG